MTETTGRATPDTSSSTTPGRPVTIIEGTAIDTGLPLPPPMDPPAPGQTSPVSPLPQRNSVLRLLLGSVVLVTEEVGSRLITPEQAAAEEGERRAMPVAPDEIVLRPLADWDEITAGDERLQTLGYLAVGATRNAGERVNHLFQSLSGPATAAMTTTRRVTSPIWNSVFLAPVRVPTERMQARGRRQVATWIGVGKAESQASRRLAETSITGFVSESVTDLSANLQVQGMVNDVVASPEVQVMIESIIANQSTSVIGSILEEARERFLTLDVLLERPFRRLLGRPRRESVAAPPFREAFIARRQPLYKGRNLSVTQAGYPAGFATRLAAFTIDMVLLTLTYTLATAFVNGTLSLFGLEEPLKNLLAQSVWWQAAGATLIGAVGLTIILGYGVFSWYLTGETIGDTIMGVQIVGSDGNHLTFSRAIRRIIGAFISALPLFLGFFWILGNDRRRGWLDSIAGSHAVYDWPAQADEAFLRRQYDRQPSQ